MSQEHLSSSDSEAKFDSSEGSSHSKLKRVRSLGRSLDAGPHRSHTRLHRTNSLGVRLVWRNDQTYKLDNLNRILRIPNRHIGPSPSQNWSVVNDHIFSEYFDPLAVITNDKQPNFNASMNQQRYTENQIKLISTVKSDKMIMPSVKNLASMFERASKDNNEIPNKAKSQPGTNTQTEKNVIIITEKDNLIHEAQSNDKEMSNSFDNGKSVDRLKTNLRLDTNDKSFSSSVKEIRPQFDRAISSPSILILQEENQDSHECHFDQVKKEPKDIPLQESERSLSFSVLKKQWENIVTASLAVSKFKGLSKETMVKKPYQSSAPQISIIHIKETDKENAKTVKVKEESIKNVKEVENNPDLLSINNDKAVISEIILPGDSKSVSDQPEKPSEGGSVAKDIAKSESFKHHKSLDENFVRHAPTRGSVNNLKQIYENKRLESAIRNNHKYIGSSPTTAIRNQTSIDRPGAKIEASQSLINSAQINPSANSSEFSTTKMEVSSKELNDNNSVSGTDDVQLSTSDFVLDDDIDTKDTAPMERKSSVRDLLKNYESKNKNNPNISLPMRKKAQLNDEKRSDLKIPLAQDTSLSDHSMEIVAKNVHSNNDSIRVNSEEQIVSPYLNKEKDVPFKINSNINFENNSKEINSSTIENLNSNQNEDSKQNEKANEEPKATDLATINNTEDKQIETNGIDNQHQGENSNALSDRKTENKTESLTEITKRGQIPNDLPEVDISLSEEEIDSKIEGKEINEIIQSSELLELPKEEIISPPVSKMSRNLLETEESFDDELTSSPSNFVRKNRSQSATVLKTGKTRELKPDELIFFQNFNKSMTEEVFSSPNKKTRSSSFGSPSPASTTVHPTAKTSSQQTTAFKKVRNLHSDELKFFKTDFEFKARSVSDASRRVAASLDPKIDKVIRDDKELNNDEDLDITHLSFTLVNSLDFLYKDVNLLFLALISLFLVGSDTLWFLHCCHNRM